MAASRPCSTCPKGTGIYFCTGCEKYFCKRDFHSHRETLNNQLDVCIEDRNALQGKMPKPVLPKNVRSPLLSQIDAWQQQTIEKVKQAAEQVRQQVIKIINSKQMDLTSAFEKLSKELVELKETEDFAEQDLKRLKETTNRLNQQLKQLQQPPTIELHMEKNQKIEWNTLIYVVEKNTSELTN